MPTISCPDCGRECSTEAAACPNCGRPCKKADAEMSSPFVDVLFYGSLFAVAITAVVLGVWWAGGFDRWLNRSESENLAQAVSSTTPKPTIQSTPSRAPVISPQALAAAQDALRALRRIDAATQVGVSYVNYQPLVIDGKAKVDEAVLLLPIDLLDSEFSSAIDAYADAGQAWSGAISRDLTAQNESFQKLRDKYRAPDEVLRASLMNEYSPAVNFIWQQARVHLNRAASLLSQYQPSPSETN